MDDADAELERQLQEMEYKEFPELDAQAQAMAEKALEKLPESVKAKKLPKVKHGIFTRLKKQAGESGNSSAPSAAPAPAAAQQQDAAGQAAAAAPAEPQPPPPPPDDEGSEPLLELEGVELCGDERWFSDRSVRRALHERVAAAHAEQKILVGSPAEEVRRICPGEERILGAGAVLRLGGAHLGGYGESDINYAFRQLSRAIHPDKNPDIADAPNAFKRLTDAAEELRQGLAEARQVLQTFCTPLCMRSTPEMLARPQEALFAEATRLLSAVLGLSGEGEIPESLQARPAAILHTMPAFRGCQGQELLTAWYGKHQLLDLFATPAMRTAYDCAAKRYRSQFLCLLNRATLAEARRQSECVRSEWQEVMLHFPEIALWQDFREILKKRVWTLDEAAAGAEAKNGDGKEPSAKKAKKAETKDGKSADPICWNFVTEGRCKKGDRCRYLHQVPENYNVNKATEARFKKSGAKDNAKTSTWAREWRDAIRSMLPRGGEVIPMTDPEIRRLADALWRDVVQWAHEQDAHRPLSLFKSESPAPAEWAFVPASDLFLVVGEGIVGITAEGMMTENPAWHRRLTYKAAIAPKTAAAEPDTDAGKADAAKAAVKPKRIAKGDGAAGEVDVEAYESWATKGLGIPLDDDDEDAEKEATAAAKEQCRAAKSKWDIGASEEKKQDFAAAAALQKRRAVVADAKGKAAQGHEDWGGAWQQEGWPGSDWPANSWETPVVPAAFRQRQHAEAQSKEDWSESKRESGHVVSPGPKGKGKGKSKGKAVPKGHHDWSETWHEGAAAPTRAMAPPSRAQGKDPWSENWWQGNGASPATWKGGWHEEW